MNPVAIGVIEAGLFGHKHISTTLPEPMRELVAIADPTMEAAVQAIFEAARTGRKVSLDQA